MSVFDPPIYLETRQANWIGEGRTWEIVLVKNGRRSTIDGLNPRDRDQIVGLFSVLGIYVQESKLGQVETPRWKK